MFASVIIGRARSTLIDPSPGQFWTDPELLDYLTAGINAVINLKADAYTKRAFVACVSGSLQDAPDDCIQVLDVQRNASGKIIRQVSRDGLSNADPGWYAATQTTEADNVVFDARNPLQFFLYPPNDGNGSVEVFYTAESPRMASLTDVIPLTDAYEAALHAYVCAQSYGKNTKRADTAKHQMWMSSFITLVTGKSQTQYPSAPSLKQQERQQ